MTPPYNQHQCNRVEAPGVTLLLESKSGVCMIPLLKGQSTGSFLTKHSGVFNFAAAWTLPHVVNTQPGL